MLSFTNLIKYTNVDFLAYTLSKKPSVEEVDWSKFDEAWNPLQSLREMSIDGVLPTWLSAIVSLETFEWIILANDISLAEQANLQDLDTTDVPRLALVITLTMLQRDYASTEEEIAQLRLAHIGLGARVEMVNWSA